MLIFLRRFARDFLYDESAWQRYVGTALFALGTLLANGGAIPGTGLVVADLSAWSGWGAALTWLAIYVGSGVKTPGGSATREAVETWTAKAPAGK